MLQSNSSSLVACLHSLPPSLDNSTICSLLHSIIGQALARDILTTFTFTSRAIWKSINAHIFEDMSISPNHTHSLNQWFSYEFASRLCHPSSDPPNPTINSQRWSPPAQYVKSFNTRKTSILGRNNLGTFIDGHGQDRSRGQAIQAIAYGIHH